MLILRSREARPKINGSRKVKFCADAPGDRLAPEGQIFAGQEQDPPAPEGQNLQQPVATGIQAHALGSGESSRELALQSAPGPGHQLPASTSMRARDRDTMTS